MSLQIAKISVFAIVMIGIVASLMVGSSVSNEQAVKAQNTTTNMTGSAGNTNETDVSGSILARDSPSPITDGYP